MDKLHKLWRYALCIGIIINLTQCQNTKEVDKSFYIELSSPDDVVMCSDEILDGGVYTLEGEDASLPFVGSGGQWGNSNKGEGSQWGTPIGAYITYYSSYEGKFYHIDFRMPKEVILDYMERAYLRWDDKNAENQEYKRIGRGHEARASGEPYESFSHLVFGFAPQGMLVVWLRYGITQIEIGRYQAKEITDPAEIEKNRQKVIAVYGYHESHFYVAQKRDYNPNLSSELWDNYRTRYKWRLVVKSDDPKHRLMENTIYFHNGETEMAFRPYINTPDYRERAIPAELVIYWETGKSESEKFQARALINWERANEVFKQAGSNSDLEVRITNNNMSIALYLNGKPLPTDDSKVYLWEGKYKDSYK
jgi:hypothetical protein